ncbi:MAG: hypothetical protein EHM33_00025 [Chloroflexi bacterium]|nr:MAG: hypothetical protein EHM33_00025 [Chloroflexota bacterium]
MSAVLLIPRRPDMLAERSKVREGTKSLGSSAGASHRRLWNPGSIDYGRAGCAFWLEWLVEPRPLEIRISHCIFQPDVRLAVSDIVTDGPLPDAIKKSLSAWAGCVAGVVEADEYIGMMKSVGFTDISVVPVFFDKETVDSALSDMKDIVELKTVSRDDVYKAVYSAKITAYKPQ